MIASRDNASFEIAQTIDYKRGAREPVSSQEPVQTIY
jgi:hypothetical protein